MKIEYQSYIQSILSSRVYDVAVETPLDRAAKLSARYNNEIFIKLEDLQPVHSFKLRGAFNKIAHLSPEERRRGVIAASAGNHAQGVALAAAYFDCPALIVMPETTPEIKVDAVTMRGAAVIQFGASYSDSEIHARELAQEQNLTFVHPYDDPLVIAGQGTVALELFKQCSPAPDYIFVCLGGGGLASGIALYAKNLFPQTKVIGVEPVEAASMKAALAAGAPVTLPTVSVFADGVAVKRVGDETFRLCKDLLDDIILTSTDEICAAIKDVFEDTRAILEPAGALSVAGAKKFIHENKLSGARIVTIASGANINFTRLRHVAERADLGEEREAVLAVTIPEKPGSFKIFCNALGPRSITEFNYRYADSQSAHVFVGVSITDAANKAAFITTLKKAGFAVLDLSTNEVAKLHVRHMVGGKTSITDERIFRFQFPERPGALLKFLNAMSPSWNISLFHYRNHGADIGRVLIGMQVPATDEAALQGFLESLNYAWEEETDNEVCKFFL